MMSIVNNNLTYINRMLVIAATLVYSSIALAQNSIVKLSALKVIDVADPSARELNKFFIEFTVSDPLSLSKLELHMENDFNPINNQVVTIPISVKDNVAQLEFEKFAQPITNNIVRIMQSVKDQYKDPYRKIYLKGYDVNGKETNQLTFDRIK